MDDYYGWWIEGLFNSYNGKGFGDGFGFKAGGGWGDGWEYGDTSGDGYGYGPNRNLLGNGFGDTKTKWFKPRGN